MSVNIDPKKEVIDARVGQAVAEEVAIGMAAQADHEAARADRLAVDNAFQSAARNKAQAERDAAVVSSSIAQRDASSASFGMWLILAVVAGLVLVGALWYANRPNDSNAPTVVINRTNNPATPAAATPIPTPAPAVTVRVPVPVPVPSAAPSRQPNQTIIVQPGASREDSGAAAPVDSAGSDTSAGAATSESGTSSAPASDSGASSSNGSQ